MRSFGAGEEDGEVVVARAGGRRVRKERTQMERSIMMGGKR